MSFAPIFYRPERGVTRWGIFLAAVGALTFLGGLFLDPASAWANLLLIGYYLLGLGLGGLVLVAFLYVCGAGWSVALRRVPEALAILTPVACVGVAVVLLCYPSLYPWAGHHPEGAERGSAFRNLWLSRPLFLLRALAYFVLWTGFTCAIVRTSRRQDDDGKVGHTYTNRRLSAAFLVVFGVTCWLSSVDWIMSLEPEWSSTIFGVYHFSGLFLGALAAVAAVAIYLERQGAFRGILSTEHRRDLGTLLFSFSSFWMYIWFSQYLLIWYVNNPEETSYYVRRLEGGWQSLFFLSVLLNWVVPFIVLLSRAAKENSKILMVVALVVLVGRWVDQYLMILPALGRRPLQMFGVIEVGLAAGGVGIFLLAVSRALRKASLLPVNDPFLIESLPHGKMYANAPSGQDGNQSGMLQGIGARHELPVD